MIIRIILYFILFYLIYRTVRKFIQFIFPTGTNNPVKGETKKKVKNFDPDDIEDIDYKEIERKK